MHLGLSLVIVYVLCSQIHSAHCYRWRLETRHALVTPRIKSTRVGLNPDLAAIKTTTESQPAHSSVSLPIDTNNLVAHIPNVIHRASRTVTVTVTQTLTRFRTETARPPLTLPPSGKTKMTRSVSRPPLTRTTSTKDSAAATATRDLSNLDYVSKYLEAHNIHRRNHSIADLVNDSELARSAAQIAATCVYQHDTSSCKSGCGQNIGAGFTEASVGSFVSTMYNREINWYPGPYGADNIDTSEFTKWGHYSQIVWKGTTKIGCATQYCRNGLAKTGYGVMPYFTVCNYFPPGNMVGQWDQVAAPQGGESVVVVP